MEEMRCLICGKKMEKIEDIDRTTNERVIILKCPDGHETVIISEGMAHVSISYSFKIEE